MPSRKVVSIFIISVALVFTIIYSSGKNGQSPPSNLSLSSKKVEVRAGENNDWEEEVKTLSAKNSLPSADSKPETLTDEFGRSFLANYISMKQSGTLDGTGALNLLDKSAQFINKASVSSNLTLKDVLVSTDNSKAAVQKYGNDLGLAFKLNRPSTPHQNEVEILVQMLQKEDTSKAQELKSMSLVYQNTVKSLIKETIPSSLALKHLKIINDTSNLADSINKMSYALSDPLLAISGLSDFMLQNKSLLDSVNKQRTELLKRGALYKQGDSGYFLYFGI